MSKRWYEHPIRCYGRALYGSKAWDDKTVGNVGGGTPTLPARHKWPDNDTQRADLAAMLPGLAAVLAR